MSTAKVALIYSEYDLEKPPFAWLDGAQLGTDDLSGVYHILGHMSRQATKDAERTGTRAIRVRDKGLLVETRLGAEDQRGRKTKVTIVVRDGIDSPDMPEFCAGLVIRKLGEVGITTDKGLLSEALEWGQAATARRFPKIVAFFRWLRQALGFRRSRASFVGQERKPR